MHVYKRVSPDSLNYVIGYCKEVLSRLKFLKHRAEMNPVIMQRCGLNSLIESFSNPIDFCMRGLFTQGIVLPTGV